MPRLSFEELVLALSTPAPFPGSPRSVECIQTHISAAFLVDDVVYKIKKPKHFLFLDFSSIDKRRHFCHEEVRLNSRMAPGVYQGVVPILWKDGAVRVSETLTASPSDRPEGDVLEWAVRMVRLPNDRTLGALIEGGRIGSTEIARLARRIAAFHSEADRGPSISSVATWETIWRNDRENFDEIEAFVGDTIAKPVFERLSALTAAELERHRPLMERRVREGVPREIHGDLRLEHIYLLPPGMPGRSRDGGAEGGSASGGGRSAPAADAQDPEFVIIDCIEFNERFRWADPVSDIAFLVMELEFVGRLDLASEFAERYFLAAQDPEGSALLPYYATYRDVVRGKVRSLQAADELVDERARTRASAKATRHFLQGLSRLSTPSDRPGLVVVQGLPGVGKSTVAAALEVTLGFRWIDTDRVRKELAATPGGADAGERRTGAEVRQEPAVQEEYGGGIYSAEWTEKTYEECRLRARRILFEGGRAIVEGSFRRDRHRAAILESARALGVTVLFLDCSVDPDEARRRLAKRPRGDSDADWRIHQRMAADWEPPSAATAPYVRELPLRGDPAEAISAAIAILTAEGLA